ncbi:MAG: BatA domain-containing protein, partial [Bacteroidota bacterium]
MNFLYPAFLWALFTLAIPVIIHLFNFRRYKLIYFSNIQLLKDVKKETRSRTRLKQWLILLSRLLMITALIFAFAQPIIPKGDIIVERNNNPVGIYLDNSFSMEAEGSAGKLIEVCKSKVSEIVEAYRPNTKFILMTNDLENRLQHLLSKEQLLEYLPEIQPSPVNIAMSEIITRIDDLSRQFNNTTVNDMFVLSDFQKVTSDLKNIKSDTIKNFFLIPSFPENTNNLFIDSVWFDSPVHNYNQTENINIKIVNNSKESYQNIPVNLFINDSLKMLGSLNIEGGSDKTLQLNYTNSKKGQINGRIEISDYPITYDNNFYFSYLIADKLNVLIINNNESNRYITALLKNDSN